MEINWDDYPNFTEWEFRCKGTEKSRPCECGGKSLMHPGFVGLIQLFRTFLDRPLVITSGYRCPTYNDYISTTGRWGPHTTGLAVDILVRGTDSFELLEAAMLLGEEGIEVTGIGVQQKGGVRYLHLDALDPETHDLRPWVWSY